MVFKFWSFCFHHLAKHFGPLPVRRIAVISLALAQKQQLCDQSGKVRSSGRCLPAATAALKETRRAAPIDATLVLDMNKPLAWRQPARRRANTRNRGESLSKPGTLEHHLDKKTRKSQNHDTKGNCWVLGEVMVASGLTDSPSFYGSVFQCCVAFNTASLHSIRLFDLLVHTHACV